MKPQTCKRCGYQWHRRKPGKTVHCPGCHSAYWDKPPIQKPPVKPKPKPNKKVRTALQEHPELKKKLAKELAAVAKSLIKDLTE